MEISRKLYLLRTENNLTQSEFAKIAHATDKSISAWENGTRSPKLQSIKPICDYFGIDFNTFADESNDVYKAEQSALKSSLMGHIDAGKTKLFSYSPAALELAKDFDTLDSHGQSAVRGLMDEELNRMAELDELEKFREPEEEQVIPRYLSPYAAGVASPIFGEEYEDYTLQSGDPKGAIFAVKVQGDSMEPYIKDGSTVFCNKDPLRDGDIGVFIVDGAGVIKQYHKEGGIVYLFSLNRKRADADVMLPPSSGRNLSCQGRVITKRKFPIPGR